LTQRPIHFLDFLHMPRASSETYNRVRLMQCADWLTSLGGNEITWERWKASVQNQIKINRFLLSAQALRDSPRPTLSGGEFLAMVGVIQILPPLECCALLEECIEFTGKRLPAKGRRLIIAGAPQYDDRIYRQLSDGGFHVVGDYQDVADLLVSSDQLTNDWCECLANPDRLRFSMVVSARQRVADLVELARQTRADLVIYLISPEDEVSGWDGVKICKLLKVQGTSAGCWRTADPLPENPDYLWDMMEREVSLPHPAVVGAERNKQKKPSSQKQRKKGLSSIADFNNYQKTWFQSVRKQVSAGAPFGVVNANSPQEILRAMDIPFVVNQWWASIVAAKQQSGRYFGLLQEHGFPSDVESYSAQGLAALFDNDEEQAPWGGLPKPDVVHAVNSTDATPRIFQYWSEEADAELFLFERTFDPRIAISHDWWNRLPDHWDEELESCRLDLLMNEMKQAIQALEARTGRKFDEEKFVGIMNLVNDQEEYYRLTRDLIATTYPAPVCVSDTMPATMVPQWHRGTTWGVDAAKRFYEEVKAKAQAGEGVSQNENLRLMWVGRGMWSDMDFYHRWRDSHGAVFVWSMYLALAADGYIRNFDKGRDPLRALAARFVVMGDELRMPTWAGAWHVREAQSHGVHGAIALSDADPFVLRALRRAGVPVLALDLDNFDQPDSDRSRYYDEISHFLDNLNG